MASKFEKCLFEVLAKIGVAELSALCDFIDTKIDILDKELNKVLAYSNAYSSQLNNLEQIARAASGFVDSKVASSALLSVARTLSPNCGALADVFQGAIEAGNLSATVLGDVTYIFRQIKNADGLIQTAKNEAADAISALHDLCHIIQLIILEKSSRLGETTTNRISDYIDSPVRKTT